MAHHSDSKGLKRGASPEAEVRRVRARTDGQQSLVIINPFTFLEIYNFITSLDGLQHSTSLQRAVLVFLNTYVLFADREEQNRIEEYLIGRIGGITHRPYLLFEMAEELNRFPRLLRFFVEQRGFLVKDAYPRSLCPWDSICTKVGSGSPQQRADTLLMESVRMWNDDPLLERSWFESKRPTFPFPCPLPLPNHGGIDTVMKVVTAYAEEIENAVVYAGADILLKELLRIVAAYYGPSLRKEDWIAGETPWLLQPQ